MWSWIKVVWREHTLLGKFTLFPLVVILCPIFLLAILIIAFPLFAFFSLFEKVTGINLNRTDKLEYKIKKLFIKDPMPPPYVPRFEDVEVEERKGTE